MADHNKQPPNLAGTVWELFLQANAFRESCGGAADLRAAGARLMLATQDQVGETVEVELPPGMAQPEAWCDCDTEANESCDVCQKPLPEVCSIKDTMAWCATKDPFDGLAHALTIVKLTDFTSATSSFYAPVGNRPAKLKSNPVVDVPEAELSVAASVLFDYIQSFLDDNEVTIDEIPQAFNLGSTNDLVENLERVARVELQQELEDSISKVEDKMEAVFNRAKLMHEYGKILEDITHHPIGVMWYDPDYLGKEYKATTGGIKTVYELQPTARRVEPDRIWFTPDWRKDRQGRAVFTTREMSAGDLHRAHTYAPATLQQNIRDLIEDHTEGYRMYSTQLFFDNMTQDNGMYDVLVGRGTFTTEELQEAGVKIENKVNTFHAAEVWYANGTLLHAKLLPEFIDNLGVYTTSFRNFGSNIWGISLYDFIIPFARMYEGAIRGVDTSVAKNAGSIISMDVGVIENPTDYLKRDDEGGGYTLDLSGDTVIQFDSTDAMLSPNWKGVPIQIDKLPSDLQQMIPAIQLALEQIQLISGIPSILSTGNPDSSAVRTNDSYRTAYRSASKQIAALLRGTKEYVLMPIILAFYRTLVNDGLLRGLPKDTSPELLLDERLTNAIQSAQASGGALEAVIPFADRISQETLNGLLNNFMRDVYELDYDVAPGSNPVGGQAQAQPTGEL